MRNRAVALLTCVMTVELGLGMHAAPDALASTHAPQLTSMSGNVATGNFPVGPLSAAKVAPAQVSAACTVNTSDPTKNGVHIEGSGDQFCSGADFWLQRIRVSVQQQRSGPFWDTKATTGWTEWSPASIMSRNISWLCAVGSGNQNYRIVTDAEFMDIQGKTTKAPGVYSGNYLTWIGE